MLHIAKYLHDQFWRLLGWLIILLAILVSALRLFLPQLDLDFYQGEIQRVVNQRAGMPVRIGDMHMALQGPHLVLRFDRVVLLDPQSKRPRLQARQVQAEVRMLQSLLEGRLVLGGAKLTGTSLRLIHRWDGSWMVNGFQERPGQSHGSVLGAFLRNTHLRIRDSKVYWLDEQSGQPPIHFSRVDLELLNAQGRHRLVANLRLGDAAAEQLELKADLREGRQDPLAVNGRLYIRTRALKLAQRLNPSLTRGLTLGDGRLDLELWGELRDGALRGAQGQARLTHLELSAPKRPKVGFKQLSAGFVMWRGDQGWHLDLERLTAVEQGRLWPPGRLSLLWETSPDGRFQLRLGADYLGLRGTCGLLALLLPADRPLQQALVGLSPTGHLTRLRLAYARRGDAAPSWRISGKVSRYRQRAWRRVPGLRGVDLEFRGDQEGGGLLVRSQDFVTEMPRLFRKPLVANRLDGYLKWDLDTPGVLHLKSEDLAMSTSDLQTLSRLELRIPLDGGVPFIDMQSDYWDGDASHTGRYLPVGIMPKPLVNWLDRALVSGHVTAGSFLLYGPLKGFPYLHDEGRFEVLFGIEDLLLDYRPGWPRIEEAVAEAHFVNNRLSIELSDGRILESRLRRAEAHIDHLKQGTPVQVTGQVDGPFGDVMRLLAETPLKRRFGHFTGLVEGRGQSTTRVDLHIPLKRRDKGSLAFSGSIDLHPVSLRLKKGPRIDLTDLHGRLDFSRSRISGSAIEGRLMGRPVVLKVGPRAAERPPGTLISTRLEADAAWLKKYFPGIATAFLEGRSQARLKLDIAHGKSEIPVRLEIHSGLRGMALRLPPPLGKTPEQGRDLGLDFDFLPAGSTELRIDYGGLLHALLRDDGQGFQHADLVFGQAKPRLSPAAQIRLRGRLQALSADAWVQWLSRRGDGQPAAHASPINLDLQVAKLGVIGISCKDTRLQLTSQADGWRVKIDSPDLSGELQVPRDRARRPLVGHLAHLQLHSADLTARQSKKPAWDQVDPGDLPALDLRVDALRVNDQPMGKLALQWSRADHGIRLGRLRLNGQGIEVKGNGAWLLDNGQHTTELSLQGHVDSLGALQAGLGWQLGIADAPLDFHASLSWPQPPHRLTLARLSGQVELNMGEGMVEEVDPGMGRLVGLLSLQALGKRLTLDFSDLYSKGLEFDHVNGDFTIVDGDAFTNDLHIESSAASIEIRGRTGLAKRDYDQQITVTPKVSSTLPLVGALAVNPAVGVALVVGQKLLGKQVDRITRTEYELTGSWEAPIFKKVKRKTEAKAQARKRQMPDLPGQGE